MVGFAVPAALVLAALGVFGWSMRQEALDREFVDSIVAGDSRNAVRTLQGGANPCARMSRLPPRPLLQMLRDLLRRSRQPSSPPSPSALALGVRHNEADVVRAILDRSVSNVNDAIQSPVPNGAESASVLICAIEAGNQQIAEMLLQRGANIHAVDSDGNGVLSAALDRFPETYSRATAPEHFVTDSRAGMALVRMLLEHGADAHEHAASGVTILDLAAYHDSSELVDLLLSRGVGPEEGAGPEGALNYAVQNEDVKMVETLLAHGAQTRPKYPHRQSPVFGADSEKMLRLLLRHGADINARSTRSKYAGETLLHFGARSRDRARTRLLLSLGADVNVSSDGYYPLMSAARYADVATLELLTSHGARVNDRTSEGWTALMEAADDGMDLNIDCLLRHGADPNRQMTDGRTALMLAVEEGNEAAVRDLLEGGAAVNSRDHDGRSALDFADENGTVIKLLKGFGARSGTGAARKN